MRAVTVQGIAEYLPSCFGIINRKSSTVCIFSMDDSSVNTNISTFSTAVENKSSFSTRRTKCGGTIFDFFFFFLSRKILSLSRIFAHGSRRLL